MKTAPWALATFSAALLALAALHPAQAQSATPVGSALAADMGCLNCHGTSPRGDAPAFKAMRERAASREGDRSGIAAHWVEEMRATTSGWRTIVGHRQVSDETARALADWLVQPPPAKPVN
jgi:cytochrome c551/c552